MSNMNANYSPGFEFQGGPWQAGTSVKQPDPFLTFGWTCQVLASGGTVNAEGTAGGSAISEAGTAGAVATYAVEAPTFSQEDWEAARYLKALASRTKNDKGEYLNKDGSVSKTQ